MPRLLAGALRPTTPSSLRGRADGAQRASEHSREQLFWPHLRSTAPASIVSVPRCGPVIETAPPRPTRSRPAPAEEPTPPRRQPAEVESEDIFGHGAEDSFAPSVADRDDTQHFEIYSDQDDFQDNADFDDEEDVFGHLAANVFGRPPDEDQPLASEPASAGSAHALLARSDSDHTAVAACPDSVEDDSAVERPSVRIGESHALYQKFGVLWCTKCGNNAAGRLVRSLSTPCLVVPARAGSDFLQRLARGSRQ